MTTQQSLSALLKKYHLQPRKSLGQNFLADPFHLAKIVEAAGLTAADVVLEIGPGPGTLTRLLAEIAGRVIAVEVDPHLVRLLRAELGHLQNLTVVEADILQTDIKALLSSREAGDQIDSTAAGLPSRAVQTPPVEARRPASYKVVANLPYYITSAVMRRLLETTPRPERMVVTVQKEVAQRMAAGPGGMSLLAVSVQFYGQPQLVHHIPAGAFYPPPKVDSAVVRIDVFSEPPIAVIDVDKFFRVVKAGFGQKRKQLKNSLSTLPQTPASQIIAALERAGVAPTRRAETLSLEEWGRLANALA